MDKLDLFPKPNNQVTNQQNQLFLASVEVVAAYIGEYLEYGLYKMLHDLFGTKPKQNDLTNGIIAAMITGAATSFLIALNPISLALFASLLNGILINLLNNGEESFNDEAFKTMIINMCASGIIALVFLKVFTKIETQIEENEEKLGFGKEVLESILVGIPFTIYYAVKAFFDDLNTKK